MALSTEDVFALQALVHRYALAATDCDASAWAALFTENGVWERRQAAAGTRYDQQVRIEGRDNLRAFAVQNLKPDAREAYVVTNCIVEGDRDTAHGRCTVIVYDLKQSPPAVFLVVDFIDEFVREANGWRINYRGAALIGS